MSLGILTGQILVIHGLVRHRRTHRWAPPIRVITGDILALLASREGSEWLGLRLQTLNGRPFWGLSCPSHGKCLRLSIIYRVKLVYGVHRGLVTISVLDRIVWAGYDFRSCGGLGSALGWIYSHWDSTASRRMLLCLPIHQTASIEHVRSILRLHDKLVHRHLHLPMFHRISTSNQRGMLVPWVYLVIYLMLRIIFWILVDYLVMGSLGYCRISFTQRKCLKMSLMLLRIISTAVVTNRCNR